MAILTRGLERELADHWLSVFDLHAISAELVVTADGCELHVPDEELDRARALYAESESGPDLEPGPEREAPTLDPSDHTEVLARTHDLVAAERLADILDAAGLYVQIEMGAMANVLGIEPPSAVVHIAASQREQAFAELEAFARDHVDTFEGAANISPGEVLEALLNAPLGRIVVRSGTTKRS